MFPPHGLMRRHLPRVETYARGGKWAHTGGGGRRQRSRARRLAAQALLGNTPPRFFAEVQSSDLSPARPQSFVTMSSHAASAALPCPSPASAEPLPRHPAARNRQNEMVMAAMRETGLR